MMRVTTPVLKMYYFEGMKRPEEVFDHYYLYPGTVSLDRVRELAGSAKHSVIIHHHTYRELCDNSTKHEYYGEQNLE